MSILKGIGAALVALSALALVVFVMELAGLANFSFFAPKYQNAERKVFENTQSYVEGKRQDLSRYRLQYLQDTTAVDREAIRSVVNEQFANFNESYLEDQPELLEFLRQMKRE